MSRTARREYNAQVQAFSRAVELRKDFPNTSIRKTAKMVGIPYPTLRIWLNHPSWFERITVNADLAYVVGAFLGDGSLTYRAKKNEHNIVLRSIDYDFVIAFRSAIFSCLNTRTIRKAQTHLVTTPKGKPFYGFSICSAALFDYLLTKKWKKDRLSNRYPIAFLRGLYDAEGSAYYCKSNRGYRVTFINTNPEIIGLVCRTLKHLGFNYYIEFRHKSTIRGGRVSAWRIIISNYKQCMKFFNLIGFSIQRKQSKQIQWQELYARNIQIKLRSFVSMVQLRRRGGANQG